MLSAREQLVLKVLYDHKEYLTVTELANRVNYSPRTVRNDLAEIKKYIGLNGLGTIYAKPKKGILFSTTQESWEKLKSIEQADGPVSGDAYERKFLICRILLKERSATMAELSRQLYLGPSGVKKALDQAKLWLLGNNVELVSIRGKGYRIQCSEPDRRYALLELFLSRLANAQAGDSPAERKSFESAMVGDIGVFLEGFDSGKVLEAVYAAEKNYSMQFSYDSLKQLIFLLSLVAFNCRRGTVLADSTFLKGESPLNRRVAECIADRLQADYGVPVPASERDYIFFAVSISEIQSFTDPSLQHACEAENPALCETVIKLIDLLDGITGLTLQSDETLAVNLFLYFRSMVERLRYGRHIRNPLLPKIKTEYANIYAITWATDLLLERGLKVELGEDEIGFLTLYIGGAIERTQYSARVLILCNYDMGVSQILRQRIQRAMPNIEVLDTISIQDTAKAEGSGCDFIITTSDIGPAFCGKDVVVVDNFLLPYDIRNIQKKIGRLQRRRMAQIFKKQSQTQGKLFDPSFVQILNAAADKESLLQGMCLQLEQKGYVTDDFAGTVLSRETNSSTHIGGGVAIPHGLSDYVLRPVISVALLEKPLVWNEDETVELVFLLALNPRDMPYLKQQMTNFYSVLCDLIDNEEQLDHAKNIHSKEEFVNYMNQLTGN